MKRTRPRTSVKPRRVKNPNLRNGEIYGFSSRTPLNAEGFMEGRFLILTKDGRDYEEFGYSRSGVIVKGSEDDLEEDARLNAVSKVLYRKGYFVGRENYEALDQDRIEKVEMIDYMYYYAEGERANKFGTYKKNNKEYVVERDKRGRFKTTARKSDGSERIRIFNDIN